MSDVDWLSAAERWACSAGLALSEHLHAVTVYIQAEAEGWKKKKTQETQWWSGLCEGYLGAQPHQNNRNNSKSEKTPRIYLINP